ncbi:hypothetical protein Hanom_Chr11g01039101 [Helianthus anomalus]
MAVLSDLELFPGVSVKIVEGVESHVVTTQASHFSAPVASVQDDNSGYSIEEDAITTTEGNYSAAGNTNVVTEACSFKLGDQRLGWKEGTMYIQLLINLSHSSVVHGQGRPLENAIRESSTCLSSQLFVPSLKGKTGWGGGGGVMIGIMFSFLVKMSFVYFGRG